MLFALCIQARTIIVAFDVTKSMQCPGATEQQQFVLKDTNSYYKPDLIWEPALEDLRSIVENAGIYDRVVILPFQDDDKTKGRNFQPIDLSVGEEKNKKWSQVKGKLKEYGEYGGNTCLLSVWERAEKYMMESKSFDFYLITDGDEDHGSQGGEARHTSALKEKICQFENDYKSKGGRAYYSLLTYNNVNSEIHEKLNSTKYFKMKVPGKWNAMSVSFGLDKILDSQLCHELEFTPSGSLENRKVNIDGVKVCCTDKFFTISKETGIVNNKLRFGIGVRSDSVINDIPWEPNISDSSESYEFEIKIHTPWNERDKYFIYDRVLRIRVIRPQPVKVQVEGNIKWTFNDGFLTDDMSKVLAVKSSMDFYDLKVENKDPNISLSLKDNRIKNGTAIISIDTTKLKDILYDYDGAYEFNFLIKSAENSLHRVQPFIVNCIIECKNTKSIKFSVFPKNEKEKVKYYKKFAWEPAKSDTITRCITYEFSRFIKENKGQVKDLKLSLGSREPMVVINDVLSISYDKDEVSFCIDTSNDELYKDGIRIGKHQVSAVIYNLNNIDKVFWNGKPYDVVGNKCVIDGALLIRADRIINPLLLKVLLLLLVLIISIIILFLKRLNDLCIRNRKPKFCGDKLGLHFNWTGKKPSIPNINLSYNGKDGPNFLETGQKSLVSASYIHTYLLSEACVEKIVLVSAGAVRKHEKPHRSFGWTLYVETDFKNHTCRDGAINRIEISPQEDIQENEIVKKVKVDVYTSITGNNSITFELNMSRVNPCNSVEDMFDDQAIKLEVYRFRYSQ